MKKISLVVLVALSACSRKDQPVIPIACVPSALTSAEHKRSQALREALAMRVTRVDDLSNGYRYHYKDGALALVDLAEWVPMERKCCPFLNFEVSWAAGDDEPELTLSGPQGVKGFLKMEMPELPKTL